MMVELSLIEQLLHSFHGLIIVRNASNPRMLSVVWFDQILLRVQVLEEARGWGAEHVIDYRPRYVWRYHVASALKVLPDRRHCDDS
jgi:hypothetical protein